MANDSIASGKKKYLKLEDLDVYNSTVGVQFYFYAPDPIRSTAT